MTQATVNTIFLWSVVVSSVLCVMFLVRAKSYRLVPAFVSYLALDACVSIIEAFTPATSSAYWRIYLVATILDYLCQIAVIFEVISHIKAYVKNDVHLVGRKSLVLVAAAFVFIATILAWSTEFHHIERQMSDLLKLDLVFDVVRVLFFTGILLTSYVLGMRWRHISVNIALGLSLYSGIALVARGIQEYTDSSTYQALWFRIADLVPIGAWCVLMLLVTRQIVYGQRLARPETNRRKNPSIALGTVRDAEDMPT